MYGLINMDAPARAVYGGVRRCGVWRVPCEVDAKAAAPNGGVS